MKNIHSISSKNKDLGGQFKSLNNQEMFSLKGGVKPTPPLPPTGGDDYPIILKVSTSTTLSTQPLPVLSTTDTTITSI